MGQQRIRARDFTVRCCHGAFCAIGFVTTVFFLMAFLWIVWFYFGLSMVQVSTGQRRALVDYSLVKPTQTTPSDQAPLDESSSNTISKLSPTSPSSSFHKSRGESKSIPDDKPRGNASLAKGDFADRDRAPTMAKDTSTVPPSLIPEKNSNKTQDVTKVEIKDDGLQTRRVASSNDNRHESAEPIKNPTEVDKDNPPKTPYDSVLKSDAVPTEDVSRDEIRSSSREYPKEGGGSTAVRDEIQSSKSSDGDTASRVPDFDRDPPRTSMRERTRYDEDEYRGSRSRIDTRDRVPYADDEYSKGDSRSYADDDIGRRKSENRRRQERHGDYSPDDVPRHRGDDDDRTDDRYRYHDDDSRYRSRDTSYDDRDEYRSRDDERYRLRDDDRRYRLRSDLDGSRKDDKYRSRYDDRDRPIIDDRDRSRIDERDRPKIDDRHLRIGDKDRPLRIDDRDIPPRTEDRDIPLRTDDRYIPIIDDRDKPIADDRDRSRIDDRDRRIIDERGRTRIDDRDGSVRKIDDRYRTRDDKFNRRKVDDKSDMGYEDRERVRAEERYRLQDDDRDRTRGYRNRDSYKGVVEDEDDYRSRVDSRRRTSEGKFIDEETRHSDKDRYRPRVEVDQYDDDTRTIRRDYKDPVSTGTDALPLLPLSKSLSDRGKVDETDYPIRRSDEIPSSVLSETRRRDRDDNYRRPSRYDDRDRISPTRVRDGTHLTSLGSHSERNPPPLTGSRSRDLYPEDTARIRASKNNDEDDRRRPYFSAGSSGYSPSNDREYKTRLPVERVETRYADRGDEVILDRRSYTSDEEDDYGEKSNSRTSSDRRRDSKLRGGDDPYEHRSRADDRDEYPRRRKDDDGEEYRRERPRSDYDSPRTKLRDSYDDYSRDGDRYDDERPVRRYDDSPRYREDAGLSKDDRPYRNIDERPADRVYPSPKIDEARLEDSRPRSPMDTKLQDSRDKSPSGGARTPESPRISPDSDRRDHSRPVERPLNAKDVIEAALRHSDMSDALRKVSYPVFDPRVSNLTSPDVIRPSERRGTTILSRRRRRLGV